MQGSALGPAELLSGLSVLLFCVVAWILAIRLLLMARRTRGLPEVSLAICYLFVAGLGYPLAGAGIGAAESLAPTLAVGLLTAGAVLMRIGLAAAFVFTWQAFRPDSGWGRAFCATGILLLGINGAMAVLDFMGAPDPGVAAEIAGNGSTTQVVVTLSGIAFGWAAVESLRYYRMTRRRQALGLADPVVVNRLLLWGVACASAVVVTLINIATALAGLSIMESASALIASALMGTANSILLIFAFLPPAPYLRFIRRRAGVPQG